MQLLQIFMGSAALHKTVLILLLCHLGCKNLNKFYNITLVGR